MALTLLFWWFPRLRNFVSHQCRQSCHCLQDDASSGVCETVAPPDNLKDLFFTFNNLSSCNLSSMVEQLSESVGDIYFPWVAVYLVILSQICTPYTYIFWTIWLIDLLTLEEFYRLIVLLSLQTYHLTCLLIELF